MGKYLITEKGHAKMDEYGIPERMRGAIVRYVEQSMPPGDFLQAVINNNLREACGRADEENKTLLAAYVMWFYNWAPSKCWGYPGAVKAWCSDET
jgi:hypothetical protein